MLTGISESDNHSSGEKKAMKQILVIGSSCVDIIINIDHLPKTEEDIHPTGHSMSLGGCAYNVASMIKRICALDPPVIPNPSVIPNTPVIPNTAVTLISPVGTGFYGEYVERELIKNGFAVNIRVPNQENGCCYCLVEAGGERTFISYHGAEYTFSKSWMKVFDDEKTYDMVYVCGLEVEEPTGIDLIEYLEEHPTRELFYAPGPRGVYISNEKTKRIYALHPILHINQSEASYLSGCTNIPQAANKLSALTGNAVIITMGERGTYCLEQSGNSYTIDGVPTTVVDTIGAGDAHIGAIMACRGLGMSYENSILMANQAAALVVGVKGATLTDAAGLSFDNI